ncbi:hypothetical protein XBLMG947_0516 [Xanthomonas bromi]|uniref:Uncharacterized protein n=1 Tax=Xanthomonas bromi TaxID=56449 RepID=A0A1C3NH97_9XANT|nr:hypothetical protein XBLMG947_0516 [Xanthomonas bromi]
MSIIPTGNTSLFRSFLFLLFATVLAGIGWQSNGQIDWQKFAVYFCIVTVYAACVIFYLKSLDKLKPFVNYSYAKFLLFMSLLAVCSGLAALLLNFLNTRP